MVAGGLMLLGAVAVQDQGVQGAASHFPFFPLGICHSLSFLGRAGWNQTSRSLFLWISSHASLPPKSSVALCLFNLCPRGWSLCGSKQCLGRKRSPGRVTWQVFLMTSLHHEFLMATLSADPWLQSCGDRPEGGGCHPCFSAARGALLPRES